MKKLLICILTLLLTTIAAYSMTFEDAKKQDKPVVVMFHMHGCGACKQFSPIFDDFASKYSDKFNFVKEDINHSHLAKSLNFVTVPAIFIVEPKTMKAKRIEDDCAWDNACFTNTLQKY